MNSLLDALGAVVIGGLFLLTIFNALFTVQVTSYNVGSQVILSKNSEQVLFALEHYYLGIVGAGVKVKDNQIIQADPTIFEFTGKFTPTASDSVHIRIEEDTTTPDVYDIVVYLKEAPGDPFEIDMGPFTLADDPQFTYFDKFGNQTTTLNEITSIQVELTFFAENFTPSTAPGFTPDQGRLIRHPITFWKYFKNRYL